MTPDKLRARCKTFLTSSPMSIPIEEEPECMSALESLCREMIVAGLDMATSGLKVSNEKLVWALKELGPTGTNAEACVKAAVEQIIWCRQEAQRVKEGHGTKEG